MRPLAHRRGPVTRARAGERGSVLIIVAISLTVLVTCTALTVDLGRVSTLRRDLQNVADTTALDLVRLIDGRTAGTIVADARWDGTQAASLARNGFVVAGDAAVETRLGTYDPIAEVFTPVATATQVPTAVEVEVTDRVEHQLAPGGTTTSRRAVAAQTSSAGFQLGSFAARLDSQQSALLGPLVGDAIGVDLIGYTGLAGVGVGLAALATELDLSVATPDELLSTELTLQELALAQAAVLRRDGDVVHAALLESLAAQVAHLDAPLTLGDLLTIAPGGAAAAAEATLDVFELITSSAFVFAGDHVLDIPSLQLGVPGVASTRVSAQVIESPRIAFGGPGTTARTSQVRLDARVDLNAVGLVGAHLDVAVEVAPSQATIRETSCGDPDVLGLDVTTGVAHVQAAVSSRIAISLLGLVDIPVATVAATTEAGRPSEATTVDFVLPPDVLGTPKATSSSRLGLSDLTLALQVQVLPTAQLPLLLRAVLSTVTNLAGQVVSTVLAPLVAAVLAALDTAVVQPLLPVLGVTLPGADITPLAIRCTGARLIG